MIEPEKWRFIELFVAHSGADRGCYQGGKSDVATAPGVQAVEHCHKRVRFFFTVELVNAAEQEKAQGKGQPMKFYYDQPDYDDQLKRTAAAAYCGAADLGEMLVAASAVRLGDAGSWYAEWAAAAERAEALATASAGRRETAAGAWLRASEYWRQAFFFVRADLRDQRLQTGWSRHRAAFRAALSLLPFTSTMAEIPSATGGLTGYLMRPAGPVVPRPTVIIPAGYDSTAEAGYVETG